MSRPDEPIADASNPDFDDAGHGRAGRVARAGDLVHTGTSFTVNDDVDISSFLTTDGDEMISIFFGGEDLTLGFYEVAALERLRDVADEAARRLQARIERHHRESQRAAG